ncbi:MAG: recombinase family protein [Clostridia bacterium]|nr:recombinase family protein [Clostridia bacterium]
MRVKTWGYCRVSTEKQNIERQVRNIYAAYPTATIFREKYTGTRIEGRKKWEQLQKAIKPGDTIVFDSVSRMSRDSEEGFAEYQRLYNAGVHLVFLKEPHINTDTFRKALNNHIAMTGTKTDIILQAINEYLMELAKEQIYIAFSQAEKEVQDLHQRTREGMQTARINGKQIGQMQGAKLITQKSIRAKEEILKHSKSFGGSLNDLDCIKLAGVAKNTFYKYKRELLEARMES